jgi:hypothetical protein
MHSPPRSSDGGLRAQQLSVAADIRRAITLIVCHRRPPSVAASLRKAARDSYQSLDLKVFFGLIKRVLRLKKSSSALDVVFFLHFFVFQSARKP